MSAAHQIKKVMEARILDGWMVGKKRKVDGVVYLTRKEAQRARNNKREAAKLAA